MKKEYIIGTVLCFIIFTLLFPLVGLIGDIPFREGLGMGLIMDVVVAGCLIIVKLIFWMMELNYKK
jgi:hypothetical protein